MKNIFIILLYLWMRITFSSIGILELICKIVGCLFADEGMHPSISSLPSLGGYHDC